MNNSELEVIRIGGDKLIDVVRKEFEKDFFIVARTVDYIVLGNGSKNVSFSRSKNKVLERVILNRETKLSRK